MYRLFDRLWSFTKEVLSLESYFLAWIEIEY